MTDYKQSISRYNPLFTHLQRKTLAENIASMLLGYALHFQLQICIITFRHIQVINKNINKPVDLVVIAPNRLNFTYLYTLKRHGVHIAISKDPQYDYICDIRLDTSINSWLGHHNLYAFICRDLSSYVWADVIQYWENLNNGISSLIQL